MPFEIFVPVSVLKQLKFSSSSSVSLLSFTQLSEIKYFFKQIGFKSAPSLILVLMLQDSGSLFSHGQVILGVELFMIGVA